ncbi:hypothetical protein N7448_009857 [Penicillium atrosanguineum]|nr:hypothetical protein N7448_009857 [Penicillium atrosanguineum]
MSKPVDPIEGAQRAFEPGDQTLRPEPNRIADRSRATGTDFDLQELPMQGDDDADLDPEQEDPMSAQYAGTVKQIGMSGGTFLRMIN